MEKQGGSFLKVFQKGIPSKISPMASDSERDDLTQSKTSAGGGSFLNGLKLQNNVSDLKILKSQQVQSIKAIGIKDPHKP